MSRYAHFDYYQQQSPSTTIDPKGEDDEMSVLDDKILDPTSPSLADRRHSYDTDAFAHRDSVWSNLSVSSNQASFIPPEGPAYAQQHQSWSVSRPESGSCTPTAGYDQYPSEGDAAPPFTGGAVGPVNAMPMAAMYRGGGGGIQFGPPGGVAMSPQSSHGWMPAPMDLADAAQSNKSPPSYRHGSPLTVRRDGIRKKNARFEIPAERTLSNIDQLISQSINEDEVKELKQQKRLLRNRQAALDSRQRKKLHTEKLEEEKKHFTGVIGELEEALQNMKLREAELLREKGEWMATQQQYNQYLEGLHMEKDEMIRVHTLETAELRKKNNILMETVEKFERGVKPADPVAGEFSGFENLAMDGAWDDFTMADDGMSLNMPHPQKAVEKINPVASDCPFSWNAFYMCLLFGAFIASNSTSLPSRSLPQLSEEYRAESANVLKAVLASSTPELSHPSGHPVPAPSTGPTHHQFQMAQMAAAPMPSSASSGLDQLHNTLVMSTEAQEREQVFSLNPNQYNSLTTFEDDSAGVKSRQPSNLQMAFEAMRSNQRMHAAGPPASDVYTRSLMWDRVPEKVIRDFRRMVQEYGAAPVKDEPVGFAPG
ncbi:uncharacterized protein PFLUO_LOCUS1490 [Penicillium psychrofluorescens]|uniref:uncharacterized protein n=1 Tax=Penicillium psychrofluorescens TaxID=3158075 RepID=UPI003CCDEE88